jgi:hypothetical protein
LRRILPHALNCCQTKNFLRGETSHFRMRYNIYKVFFAQEESDMRREIQKLRIFPAIAAVAFIFFALLGCSQTSSEQTGSATLVLTDAASDQIDVFEVDVVQVTLKKLNGATVTTLPRRQRVDFATLTDVGQILVAARIPAGFYRSAVMTLDFSNVVVIISGSNSPAAIYDKDGNPLTGQLDVEIEFDANNRPCVALARCQLFEFDFNIDSSVTVDVPGNRVTVMPVMSASFDPTNPKPVIVAGKLVSVDTGTGRIVLDIHNPRTNEVICQFTVATGPTTVFQVNGVPSAGAAGLAAFAQLAPGTCVFAHGTIDQVERELHAWFVEGGAGVPGNGQDWAEGLITARTGGAAEDPVLTLLGCSYDHSTHTWSYNQTLTVNAEFSGTAVLRRGAPAALDTDYLNVGQRISVFGTLDGTVIDATGAAQGVIRCIRTDIYGFAAGPISEGKLTIDLVRIGLRCIALFNFDIDGTVVADPAAFVIGTGSLDVPGIVAGSPLRIIGFFAPVTADSSEPDFTAETIIDRSDVASLLFVQWMPPSLTAFYSISGSGLTLDLAGATTAVVDYGFVGFVSLFPSPAPQVVPRYERGLYIICNGLGCRVFTDFNEFAQALSAQIGLFWRVCRIHALGRFEPSTQVLSATIVTIVLRQYSILPVR